MVSSTSLSGFTKGRSIIPTQRASSSPFQGPHTPNLPPPTYLEPIQLDVGRPNGHLKLNPQNLRCRYCCCRLRQDVLEACQHLIHGMVVNPLQTQTSTALAATVSGRATAWDRLKQRIDAHAVTLGSQGTCTLAIGTMHVLAAAGLLSMPTQQERTYGQRDAGREPPGYLVMLRGTPSPSCC